MIRTLMITAALALTGCTSLLAPLVKPAVTAEAPSIGAGDWVLDDTHASVIFHIDHLGFSAYPGRFERLSARMNGDPKNPGAAQLEAEIDMTSLDIANDSFAATLMGPDWFDAGKFPKAAFRSTRIVMDGPTDALVEGQLTLKGITKPLTLKVHFNGGARDALRKAEVAGFSATGKLKRSDFGISKYSGLLTDEVTLSIEAEFLRR